MGKLVRSIARDGAVMCCALDATDIAGAAEQIHKTSAVITAGLGRLMTAAAMMGAMLKGRDDSVTLRVNGGGPSGSLIAVSDASGNVRGYAENAVVELPLNSRGKLDVGGAVGKDGFLSVIKYIGLKEPHIGQVPLVSGEIAEDVTSYYAVSEQIPTVCGLGVLVNPNLTVKAAGGYLVQLLPGADDGTVERLEQNINALPPVSQMIQSGMSPEQICLAALEGFSPEILDETNVGYVCNCSRERVERALLSLGREELRAMRDEEEQTEVGCQFCNKKYRFGKEDLTGLIERA